MNCSKCNCLLPDEEPTITHITQRECIIALGATHGATISTYPEIALKLDYKGIQTKICPTCRCLILYGDDEPTITHDTQRDCIIALYAVRGAAIESVRAIALEQGDDWLRKFAETHGLKVEKIKELL